MTVILCSEAPFFVCGYFEDNSIRFEDNYIGFGKKHFYYKDNGLITKTFLLIVIGERSY